MGFQNGMQFTQAGLNLLAHIQGTEKELRFTRIALGDGKLETGITALNQLVQERLSLPIADIRTKENQTEIRSWLTNAELEQGFYIREKGLFALHPDSGEEVLYAYGYAGNQADFLPSKDGAEAVARFESVLAIVDQVSNVKADVTVAVGVSEEDMTAYAAPLTHSHTADCIHFDDSKANLGAENIQTAVEMLLGDLRKADGSATDHIEKSITSEEGVHGFRFFNDVLQFKDSSGNWVDIETGGGGGVAPSNVITPKIKVGNEKLTLSWGDPGDTVVNGQTICTWKGTKLVQKVGAYPENIRDGTELVDNRVKDTYKTNGFVINNLNSDTIYYFALFPYSDQNAVNENAANRLTGTPQPCKKMTVNIDLTNSNPATCITYADDAVGMTPASSAWDEFFGHYPVLFKNGREVGKLKATNFAQFEDGSPADITSGSAGDVMIAFPRRGLKITTVGNTLTISMTDDPDNTNFEYLAHTRGSTRKEKFYLGAYKGFKDISDKLRSLSGKVPTGSQPIGTFRTQAQANGYGYEQSGFYQLTFRQAMFLLKYRNLDSQTAVGRGVADGSGAISTGNTNTRGMDWGETTGKLQMKLFGLEDFWGNVLEYIDGIVTDSSWNMLTATTAFNDTGSGYTNQGKGATAFVIGWLTKPQGTTETGFIVKECTGSATTYFSDQAYLYASCVASFGGVWRYEDATGAFCLGVNHAASGSGANTCGRLMYL